MVKTDFSSIDEYHKTLSPELAQLMQHFEKEKLI